MIDILNLAIPYFGLIFIGFACGKARGLPEQGLAWMNFFLLYVSLPALLFGIMSKTPFEELNNPPFLIATTLGTSSAFVLAMFAGRLIGKLRCARRRWPVCPAPMAISVIWGPAWRWPCSVRRPPHPPR
jgi:malonate transporter and related proteins